MTPASWFWLCLFLAIVFGGWTFGREKNWSGGVFALMVLIALALLGAYGAHGFGSPIHGG